MSLDWVLPLVTLTAMEIVLGIDNIVFLAIIVDRLPPSQRKLGRYLGLGLALGGRLVLLAAIQWVLSLQTPLFHLSSMDFLPDAWLSRVSTKVDGVTGHDLILVVGGLFLIAKSTREIHKDVEHDHGAEPGATPARSLAGAMAQIIAIDVIFSLDSVISAIGMANELWVMATAMIVAVAFMAAFAGKVSRFVQRHPTMKMLAMSFLVLIGVMLFAEGLGTHVSKGYIYFAMAFSIAVELLNLRARGRRKAAPPAPQGAPAA